MRREGKIFRRMGSGNLNNMCSGEFKGQKHGIAFLSQYRQDAITETDSKIGCFKSPLLFFRIFSRSCLVQ